MVTIPVLHSHVSTEASVSPLGSTAMRQNAATATRDGRASGAKRGLTIATTTIALNLRSVSALTRLTNVFVMEGRVSYIDYHSS